ncbi:MAG TPA: GtrA family protein [Bryobacteraceae bacterium]|nr:GtrA family protein [Bryobacteraceae bacterium]
MNVCILIPAYHPGPELLPLVEELAVAGYRAIVVVDDGSGPSFSRLFAAVAAVPGVTLLRHAVNLGKGAALKTGFNHILCVYPESAGVVTADADGQHAPADIARVADRLASEDGAVVLGVRQFAENAHVPWRSRFGNRVSIGAVHLLIGQSLSDTQTGLRGLPLSFLPHLLRMRSTGYEFELDMLIACRHHSYEVAEVPIRAIYLNGNQSSHFNPLLDSLRIYFVLLRFGFVSLVTAVLDNAVFALAFNLLHGIGPAQIAARTAAVAFNYFAARKAVFLSRENHAATFPRYLLLVAASGLVSYALIQLLTLHAGLSVFTAKLVAEATLFIANFALQRDFVFRKEKPDSMNPEATDWDSYYKNVPKTAHLTRKVTANAISHALTAFRAPNAPAPVILEIGGANSCFMDRVVADLRPREYHVMDTNRHGLDLLERRSAGAASPVLCHEENCLHPSTRMEADIVFSIGLIEHFDPEGTRQAIKTHFDLLKPGGWALISFPTPTWLYRVARGMVSALGQWKFPDERPLQREEVAATLADYGEVVHERLLWPLIFTQRLMLVRKRA